MSSRTEWELKKSTVNIRDKNINVNFDEDVLKILLKRGIDTDEKILEFLYPNMENLKDESKLKDIEEAVNRIIKAKENNEKICIYGDYDVDGITSTSLLYLMLLKLEIQNIMYYIPVRDEGYGINTEAIREIASQNVDLIISVDCGITSYKEVDEIKMLGMDVIITDHHNILDDKIPETLVVNPKREDNEYSFRELAGVGTIYMVCKYLYKKINRTDYNEYLDLVAIGTIADLVPLLEDNRILVKYGLKKMKNSNILAIKRLIKELNLIEDNEINSGDIAFKLAPVFNAAGRIKDAKIVVKLLTSKNIKEVDFIIQELLLNNKNRKEIQEKIVEDVVKNIEKDENRKIIISNSPKYHHGVIGIVASRIVELYNKPTIIIEEKIEENIGVGSCRSLSGIDITKVLNYASSTLLKYGGHKAAAGFTVKLDKIEEFKNKIYEYFDKYVNEEDFKKVLTIDHILPINKISLEFLRNLSILKPFGMGNQTPVFLTKNLMLDSCKLIGNTKEHMSLDFSKQGFKITKATWFNSKNEYNEMKNNLFYDIVYKLKPNNYNNKKYLSVLIDDIKKSKFVDDKIKIYSSLYNTYFPIKTVFNVEKNIEIDKKLNIVLGTDRVILKDDEKYISRLDDNISNLLIKLNEYYNFNYKIDIKKVIEENNNKIVYANINRDYSFKTYSIRDAYILKQIKKHLFSELEYNDIYREILSNIFKNKKNTYVNINNIKIKNQFFEIEDTYFDNLILNIAIFNFIKENKKLKIITNKKSFNEYLSEYIEKVEKIEEEKNEYIDYIVILDKDYKDDEKIIKNIQKLVKSDYNYLIISYVNDEKLEKNIKNNDIEIIFKEIEMKNVKHISEIVNYSHINLDTLYLSYLPFFEKNRILNLENTLIYADNSILEYYYDKEERDNI